MNTNDMPSWLKSITFVVIILTLIQWAVSAIFQKEITDIWSNQVRPYLISTMKVDFHFEVSRWIIFICLVFVLGIILLIIWRLNRPSRILEKRVNPKSLRLPKAQEEDYNSVEVIKARTKIFKGELTVDEFAKIVEDTVNFGKLKPDVGTGLLEEFGYTLALRSNKSYFAHKVRRN